MMSDARSRMYTRDAQLAFLQAIAAGTLSLDPALRDYQTAGTSIHAGNWMYMYSLDGYDYFKNIALRHYITSKIPEKEIPQEA